GDCRASESGGAVHARHLPLPARSVPPVASPDGHGPLAAGQPAVLLNAEARRLLDKRVLFFGGKGGVGKTTSAAAAALAASRAGKRVLLVSTDPAHNTSDIFDRPIGADIVDILPNLRALEIDAAHESARYVSEVKARIETL